MLRRRALLLALSTWSLARTATADETAWAALREPGTVAIMRHALAPGTGDPAGFVLDDCTTQRNLDDRGRAQARAVGDAFRARDIRVDRVLTSQWCRCRETAQLLELAPVEDLPALNSFFAERSMRDARTAAVRAFLRDLGPNDRVVLVSHQVNIQALTGRGTRSGELLVGSRRTAGAIDVEGAILVAP